jgi:release factor glutamine methyltransferase
VFAEDEARLLAAVEPDRVEALVARRVAGEPLEHLLGWVEFLGRRVVIEAGVFVPRRRTEFLARRAIALAAPGAVVLDLCCGSGAIGSAVAAAVAGVQVHAVDIEPAAVRCAERNLPGGHAYLGDLYAPLPRGLRGRVDLLVVNAPYIPTGTIGLLPPEARLHEPRAALDGGADGLDVQRRVIAGAPGWLAPGGALLVETSERQSSDTRALMRDAGLTADVVRYEPLDATVVIGRSGA